MFDDTRLLQSSKSHTLGRNDGRNLKFRYNSFQPDDMRHGGRRTQSFIPQRSSTLRADTYKRIEEWSRNTRPEECDATLEEDRRNTVSSWKQRSPSEHRPRSRSSQPMPVSDYDIYDNDDVTPWDSISLASFRNESMAHRDSGMFEMYGNDAEDRRSYHEPQQWDPRDEDRSTLKRYSSASDLYSASGRGKNRRNTTRSLREQVLAPKDRLSVANSRLLNCMDSLDMLSKKLKDVARVSSDVKSIQKSSTLPRKLGKASQKRNFDNESLDWRIGNEAIPQNHYEEQRRRHRSFDSASTDSGINSTSETGNPNFTFSRPQGRQRYPTSRPVSQPSISRPRNSNRSLRRDEPTHKSFPIVGYPEPISGHHYPRDDSSMPERTGYFQKPRGNPGGDFDEIYGSESLYDYGNYAPSSVCEEDLHQNNGWFYLPANQPGSAAMYQASQLQQNTSLSQPNVYLQPPLYPNALAPQASNNQFHLQQSQAWMSKSYGALSSTFENPAQVTSPFSAAIVASCAKEQEFNPTTQINEMTYASPQAINYAFPQPLAYNTSQSQTYDTPQSLPFVSSQLQTYDSPQSMNFDPSQTYDFPQSFNYDVLPSTPGASGVENKKRKSVRFSQTVQERIEKSESEVEDTTSVMKGEGGESEKPQIDLSLPETTISNDFAISAPEQSLYDFPKGHIPSSCMCSECVLIRANASQFSVAASRASY